MIRLSRVVTEILDRYGLNPVIFPGGSHFIIREVKGNRIAFPVNFSLIERHLLLGCTPVTYGDVTYKISKREREPTIISGDEIAYAIAKYTPLRYSLRVIFISDVEAIYRSKDGPKVKKIYTDGTFIDEEGSSGSIDEIELWSVEDKTGGMRAKLNMALRIASLGIPVYLSNSIEKALSGRGTKIE